MMKKILALTFLILSACASSDVATSTSENPATESKDDTSSASAATIPVEKNDPEIRKDEKVNSSQISALDEAIKQQNDDAIQKAAGVVLSQNSKDPKALNALAMTYYKKGRLEAASYLLNKAIGANPNSSELYSNMGLILLSKNERREAVKSFRKAIDINPLNGIAGSNVGSIYVQEKDYNKAALSLEIAIKNGPRDFKTMTNYAIALAGTGRTKEAAEIYEKLMKENPSQKEVMLDYSILLIDELQKYKEGLDLLNRLKFVGASAESRQLIKELEIRAKAGVQ